MRADLVQQQGGKGHGVTVAVLDSGIAANPDLGSRLLAWVSFAGGQDPQLQILGVRVLVAAADEALARRLLAEAKAEAEAEAEARRAETRRAEALAEKLRSLGIDPNQV